MGKLSALRTWLRLTRNGLDVRSALKMRRGRFDDIRFRGRRVAAPDGRRLSWTAMHVWGGAYDLPGFIPAPGERVADVGANVGVFSVLAAARGARVTAVEPHPETFAWLRRNVGAWDVECRRAAVVGHMPAGGAVRLVLDRRGDTAHHVAAAGRDAASAPAAEVPALAFADLVAEGFDLIKLDVEGAEFEIVAHTPTETLARVRRLVAEVHRVAGDPELVRARLADAGLTVALVHDPADPDHVLLTARGDERPHR